MERLILFAFSTKVSVGAVVDAHVRLVQTDTRSSSRKPLLGIYVAAALLLADGRSDGGRAANGGRIRLGVVVVTRLGTLGAVALASKTRTSLATLRATALPALAAFRAVVVTRLGALGSARLARLAAGIDLAILVVLVAVGLAALGASAGGLASTRLAALAV